MKRFWIMLGMALAFSALRADVKMPAIFGDHMVLAQGKTLRFWGTASPGEKITVKLNGAAAETTADSAGKWSAELPPFKVDHKPTMLEVTGNNKLTFRDVLIGDVYLASGQSNMEWSLERSKNGKEIALAAKDPEVRVFYIKHNALKDPGFDVPGEWKVENYAAVKGVSGVGYQFAKEMRAATGNPVGLICSYWGGAAAEAFIPRASGEAKFPHFVRNFDRFQAEYPAKKAAYDAELPNYKKRLNEWRNTHGKEYNEELKKYFAETAERRAKGLEALPRPQPKEPMPRLNSPEMHQRLPFCLYNGMIRPIMPYALTAVIWYQGCSNAGTPLIYEKIMAELISVWRDGFKEPELPFYFVQLANFMRREPKPSDGFNWAFIRESQTKNMSIPNTGMALAIDAGEANDIHPTDKTVIAKRLALWEKKRLGMPVNPCGPMFESREAKNGKTVVRFKTAGKLAAKGDKDDVKGFAVAGPDKKFHWAKAAITGDKEVALTCPEVSDVKAVRYGWANNPEVTLYDDGGLPAVPFRTDDWNPDKIR